MKLICSIDLISLTSYFQFQLFKNKNIKQRTDFTLELPLIKFSSDTKLLW